MSLLARFKKPGGVEKLVELIESSDAKVRENILKNIRGEDPEFTEQVESKLFFWEDMFGLEPMVLTEIIQTSQPAHLAAAMIELPEEQKKKIEGCMEVQQMAKVRDEQELIKDPSKAIIATGRKKIVEGARQLQRQGKIQLKGKGSQVVAPEVKDGKLPECVRLLNQQEEKEYATLKKKWDEIFGAA